MRSVNESRHLSHIEPFSSNEFDDKENNFERSNRVVSDRTGKARLDFSDENEDLENLGCDDETTGKFNKTIKNFKAKMLEEHY